VSLSRILSVQPHAARGGPAIQHLAFLDGLARRGHEIHVVIPEAQEMMAEYRAIARSVLCLPSMPCVPRTTAPWQLAGYGLHATAMAWRIARQARQLRADVVHTFNEAFPAGPMGARFARLPSVVQIIGMSIFQPPWVARPYVRLLDASADRLVGCQTAIQTALVQLGVAGSKLAVVYNAVDTEAVRSRAEAEPRPGDSGAVRVGMVAGLDPRKGHLDFVAAAAQVLRAVPAARFYIVGRATGNEPYLTAIREHIARHGIADAIELTGAVARAEPWIASFDVHCIPSLTEALSVAGLEAMALARPIVATNVGGNPEEVVDGESGLLCRVSDPDDLAAKVVQLLCDADLRARMGAAARKRAEDLFSLGANVGKLSAILEQARVLR
jgi:glycosyltransferase involved in cell wall biosynthesis